MSPARGTNRALALVGAVVVLAAAVGFAIHAARGTSGDMSALTGKRWTLTGIITAGHAAAPSHHFGVASISFDGKGGIVANDGCNDMGGRVEVGGHTLTVGRVFSTLVGCISGANDPPDPATDPITAMDQVLLPPPRTVAWQIANSHLRLTGPTGDPVLEFTSGLDPFADAGSGAVAEGVHGQVRYRLDVAKGSAGQVVVNLQYLTTPTSATFGSGRAATDAGGYVLSTRTVLGNEVLVSGIGPKAATRFAFSQTGQTPVDLPRFPISKAQHVQAFLGFLPLRPGVYEVIAYDAAGHVLATAGPTHN